MGCAASTDGAGRRRRDGASTTRVPTEPERDPPPAADAGTGRRRGREVAPEPMEGEEEPAHGLPTSPSFRFYCQTAAKVDALVAAADGDGGGSDGTGTATETHQAIIPHSSNRSSEPKQANGWLKFRGTGIAAAMSSLFGRHRSAAPPLPAATKSAASSPAAAADAVT